MMKKFKSTISGHYLLLCAIVKLSRTLTIVEMSIETGLSISLIIRTEIICVMPFIANVVWFYLFKCIFYVFLVRNFVEVFFSEN